MGEGEGEGEEEQVRLRSLCIPSLLQNAAPLYPQSLFHVMLKSQKWKPRPPRLPSMDVCCVTSQSGTQDDAKRLNTAPDPALN